MNTIARKTVTSSEVKKRYNDKTYKQYTIALRKVEDAELITLIEALKAQGRKTTEAFKELMQPK